MFGTRLLRWWARAANDGGVSDAELLELVNEAIAALLSGGAVQAWREGGHQISHMKIGELMELKQTLENRIAMADGGMCLPILEVDI
jgi:hypothetical protein